jgi:hypothetical protein
VVVGIIGKVIDANGIHELVTKLDVVESIGTIFVMDWYSLVIIMY